MQDNAMQDNAKLASTMQDNAMLASTMQDNATLYSIIQRQARTYGDAKFLFDASTRTSFNELANQSLSVAKAFHSFGLRPGDAILSFLPNWRENLVSFAAASANGAVFAIAPVGSKDQRIHEIISLVKPKIIIVMATLHLDALIGSGYDGVIVTARLNDKRGMDFEQLFSYGSEKAEDFEPCETIDVEALLFTSGSTGSPKGVMCTAEALNCIAEATARHLYLKEDDAFYVPLSWCHVFGMSTGLFGPIIFGKRVVTGERYYPERALDIIEQQRCTIEVGVPTMYIRQLKQAKRLNRPIPLRAGLIGGGGCPPDLVPDYEAYCGCKLLSSYGMTEATGGVTSADLYDTAEKRHRAQGQALNGVDLKIVAVGSDKQQALTPYQRGEILFRGRGIMGGYYTGGPFVSDPELKVTWFETGDVGYLDEEGFLYVIDRISSTIIRGGMNVYPSEIERLYSVLPEVLECALVGYPDDELGQRTCLVLTLANTQGMSTPKEFRDYAYGVTEKHKVPDKVIILEEMPKLEASGKIDMKDLRMLAAQES